MNNNPIQQTQDTYQVLLYYKFVEIASPEQVRAEQYEFCKQHNLHGRILVAPEGINGTVSGLKDDTQAYVEFMSLHELFKGIEFKIDPHHTHAFNKLHVRVKSELVNFSVPEAPKPWTKTAPYIEPQDFQQLLKNPDPDVFLLDARSTFEYEVGHFKDAQIIDIQHFRELPERLEQIAHLKDKKIITYCTGGIRCEKLTGLMMEHGFEQVYQLHGGIINYSKVTGGENFEGQCYVFDKRVVAPVNFVNPNVIGKCKICNAPTERMINCANADCNEHFLICDTCADERSGCCSEDCFQSPKRRTWDGTGQYHRGVNSKSYLIAK